MLGRMHYDGDGVPQDFAEARRLYGLAAAQGHAVAQFSFGSMHYHDADQWRQKGPSSAQAASEYLAALSSSVDVLCSRQVW